MSPEPLLKIQGLTKSFGEKKVHRGIDLELFEGECLGLLGGSGLGKSLILRSIIGLENPDSGSIFFRGKNLLASNRSREDWYDVRKQIGYVFQNGALFDSLTVYENLAYPLRAHSQLTEPEIASKITEMLALIDMPGSESLLPGELSGGMQKRAGLARSMILGPSVILLDEPTAGLDPANTKRFIENILTFRSRGTTALFVTHDIPSAVALCDRVAVLDQGRIHSVQGVAQFRNSQDPVIQKFNFGVNLSGANRP